MLAASGAGGRRAVAHSCGAPTPGTSASKFAAAAGAGGAWPVPPAGGALAIGSKGIMRMVGARRIGLG